MKLRRYLVFMLLGIMTLTGCNNPEGMNYDPESELWSPTKQIINQAKTVDEAQIDKEVPVGVYMAKFGHHAISDFQRIEHQPADGPSYRVIELKNREGKCYRIWDKNGKLEEFEIHELEMYDMQLIELIDKVTTRLPIDAGWIQSLVDYISMNQQEEYKLIKYEIKADPDPKQLYLYLLNGEQGITVIFEQEKASYRVREWSEDDYKKYIE